MVLALSRQMSLATAAGVSIKSTLAKVSLIGWAHKTESAWEGIARVFVQLTLVIQNIHNIQDSIIMYICLVTVGQQLTFTTMTIRYSIVVHWTMSMHTQVT